MCITDGQMTIIPKAGRWKSSWAHAKAAAIVPGLQNSEKYKLKLDTILCLHYIYLQKTQPAKSNLYQHHNH